MDIEFPVLLWKSLMYDSIAIDIKKVDKQLNVVYGTLR